MTREHYYGIGLAAFAALLLYLLHKNGLLHESVSAGIVTPSGTVVSDPVTGAPQYDTRNVATVPEQEAFAVKPIDANGNVTEFPSNPVAASCPIGYRKWKNVANGSYWCLPE